MSEAADVLFRAMQSTPEELLIRALERQLEAERQLAAQARLPAAPVIRRGHLRLCRPDEVPSA